VGWRKLRQNGICGGQPGLQCGLDLVVLMVLIEANIYFSFSGGFLYSRGGRGWTVLVEDHWVWIGLEGKKPNRTEINWFEPVFGSVRFNFFFKKIRFGCLFWFKTEPNWKCSALIVRFLKIYKLSRNRYLNFFKKSFNDPVMWRLL